MPPKKDPKDKKKDKSEEQKNEAEEERELVEKELVIGYLRSKLNRYQDNGDRLQVDVLKLTDELETQKLNLRDINEFLTNELKARSLTTSALEAKVAELNGMMDEVRKSHEAALAKQRGDKDREIERLEGVVREHERKARITQEFLDKKEAMETELQSLKETLSRKTKEFEQQTTDIDRQHIQDRERWKREMAQKIKETKLQMMKLTDNQLEMTTKRTIMENEQMSIELSYQSRQTEKLLNKNSKLMEENAELRRQLELSKQTEEELARRNNLYQKTIKTLLSKLQDQGYAAAESDEVVGALDQRLGDLAAHLHLAQLQLEEKAAEADQLRARLDAKSSEVVAMSSSFDDTARFLLSCVADVREKVVTVVREERLPGGSGPRPPSPEGSSAAAGAAGAGGGAVADITVLPGRLDELSLEQRERVLAWLLERLHVYSVNRGLAGPGIGPLGGVPGLADGPGGAAGPGGRGGADASSSGVTLPPIPSFNRRQYAGHPQGPLSTSAGNMGQALAGEWGPSAGVGVGVGGASGLGSPGASRMGRLSTREGGDPSGLSALSLGPGAPSASAVAQAGPSQAQAQAQAQASGGVTGGLEAAASSLGYVVNLPVGAGYSISADNVGAGMGMGGLLPTGVIGGAGYGGAGDVDEALAKVLSEVRPWGKRSTEQPLSVSKHNSQTYLKRGTGRGPVKV
ncbi:hypothetical protein HYH03_013391 [Edaphochlamys debaryana]|uniref:Cilia- and flagella-associated protein 157 n=1 Tax=Edaphochlamys debaryana TaxID=47281 RepID=A0A835XPY6_9CHLO|nr:hypothetical protein HYH03_013391 [Edaphochlamys debaryana]|eukprot:KAG2488088.1 hypothetical protein HYH03_013391 [Edaphochlamys debaryana]